jgi:hypothetical protein
MHYMNITLTILEFIYRPVFYSKHNVSETGFYLSVQVVSPQLGPVARDILFPD